MAYIRNIWKSNDRITKEKLNNIEEGIYQAHKNLGITGDGSSDLSFYQPREDSDLLTKNKKITGAINELFQNVSNGKTLIASALADKGVIASNTSTFQQLANAIKSIQSGNLNNRIVTIDGEKYRLTEDSEGNITATLAVFSISNTLTNCSSNNSATTAEYGSSYSAVITANNKHELSNVTVVMGGIDVTSSVYSGGTISISSVEGDIAIIANAIATETVTTYTIVKTLNGCTLSNTATEISAGSSYKTSIILEDNYEISSVRITMNDIDITSGSYYDSSKYIDISSVTGDIEINVTTIYVSKECTGLNINDTSLIFTERTSKTLVATVTPSDCVDNIYWYSDNENVATVNNGIVTPVRNGSCIITVTCGSYIATCSVNVAIVVTPETLSIEERIMSLMYPMPQRHDFVPHGAPAEWKSETKMYLQTKPTSWSAINARLQVYRVEGSNYTINTGVEIKDFNVYGWKNNNWHLVKEISIPQGNFYAADLADNANTNFSQSVRINSNSITVKLTSDMLINTSNGVRDACYYPELGLINYDADFEYIFISAKMRKVKWNENGIDDLNGSFYCASCRGQWYEKIGSVYDTNHSEIAQPKFTEITTKWNLYSLTTVPQDWGYGFPITKI